MPLTITTGQRKKFEDPIGLLINCHRRIERFLYIFITIHRRTHGGILREDESEALTCAMRYFRESAPRHISDEEESLFPKLKQSGIAAQLERLEQEHRSLEEDHGTLNMLAERWLFVGSLCEGDSLLFGNILSRLSRIYHGHIRIEECQIFPAARAMLCENEIASIRKEMAERRI